MQEIRGARLQSLTTPGSLGVVKDVIYRQCFWPVLDEPFSPFADGSSGIQVEGPPTPRNIVFPDDTVFLPMARSGVPTNGAAFFLREVETAQLLTLADDERATAVHRHGNKHIALDIGIVDAKEIASGAKTRERVLSDEIARAIAQSVAR